MVVLDTNVISELMKTVPDPQVIAWLDAHSTDSVWTTSISIFEVPEPIPISNDRIVDHPTVRDERHEKA